MSFHVDLHHKAREATQLLILEIVDLIQMVHKFHMGIMPVDLHHKAREATKKLIFLEVVDLNSCRYR